MLIEGETSGQALEEVLAKYGRSRSTYYEKLRRFRDEGLEGLIARPPGPKSPWRRPLEVVRFVVTSRLRHPERSAAAIADDLARLGHAVSVRSVERTLSQFGLTRHTASRPSSPAVEAMAAHPVAAAAAAAPLPPSAPPLGAGGASRSPGVSE
jgi:transposase